MNDKYAQCCILFLTIPSFRTKWGLNVPVKKAEESFEPEKPVSGSPLISKTPKALAEVPNSSSYAALPVSEFGAAMLQSMSASSTKEKLKKPDSKPIQYVPRPVGLGLGASQVTDISKLKQRKPVELALGIELAADEQKTFKSKAPADELLSRHANYVGIDERAPKRIKTVVEVGSLVTIESGKHKGLTGKVLKPSKDNMDWIIELAVNREIVSVHKTFVVLTALASKETPKPIESDKLKTQEKSWLYPGLKVRIVSKNSFECGRFYNVKGVILDVHGHAECSLRLVSASSERKDTILPAVPQWALETCIPSGPDPIRPSMRYLKEGEYFHAPFRLLNLDDHRGEAVIQLEDDFSVVITAKYDDICEFVEIY